MKTIKFRAWDGRRMIAGQPFWSCVNNWQGTFNDWILMQFTGLKDKNGVEIYEGDIYRVDYMVYERLPVKKLGKIIYNHDGFKLSIPRQSNPIRLGSNSNKNNGEVIGNIYENPELLQEEKP